MRSFAKGQIVPLASLPLSRRELSSNEPADAIAAGCRCGMATCRDGLRNVFSDPSVSRQRMALNRRPKTTSLRSSARQLAPSASRRRTCYAWAAVNRISIRERSTRPDPTSVCFSSCARPGPPLHLPTGTSSIQRPMPRRRPGCGSRGDAANGPVNRVRTMSRAEDEGAVVETPERQQKNQNGITGRSPRRWLRLIPPVVLAVLWRRRRQRQAIDSRPGWSPLLPLANLVDWRFGWHRLPWPLGLAIVVALRHQLRRDNLHD